MTPRILVTRAAADAARLADALSAAGFAPVPVPTIAIDERVPGDQVESMLETLAGADWLVITSAHGARVVARRMAEARRDMPPGVRVAAVGPGTADALRALRLPVHHVPDTYTSRAIAGGLGDLAGRRIVIAAANRASPELRQVLRAAGAVVEVIVAYRVIEGPSSSRAVLRSAVGLGLDGLAFTSGSTVRGLLRLVDRVDSARVRSIPAFCIGPPTAATAVRHGFVVAATATTHTGLGLAEAIRAYFTGRESWTC